MNTCICKPLLFLTLVFYIPLVFAQAAPVVIDQEKIFTVQKNPYVVNRSPAETSPSADATQNNQYVFDDKQDSSKDTKINASSGGTPTRGSGARANLWHRFTF
jgi:hypothetical protein